MTVHEPRKESSRWILALGKARDILNKRALDHEKRTTKGKHFRQAARVGKCGAKKRTDGKPCGRPAGWGTDHAGVGHCRTHGGNAPNHKLNAAKQRAVLMGAPKEINPVDALYWMIKIAAGEVEWLSDQIATLDEEKWIEDTMLGKQMHLFVRERHQAMDRLATYSSQAIKLGLAERAVRLAENYGVALSRLLRGVLEDLNLTPEQQQLAPHIVRKHLILLEGGQAVSNKEREQLKELTA